MYITQEVDYAMRIVHCLAKNGCRRDARKISEEVDVTLRFSLKILGKLSAAGIVNSFKGNRGGYELANTPDKITMKDVLCAVEGPYVMNRCLTDKECRCTAADGCGFQKVFARISADINRELDAVNFASLISEG